VKKINIKISRKLFLSVLVVLLICPFIDVKANLSKKFRENFAQIVRDQYHNAINYSLDDETGWEISEKDGKKLWSCVGGKCKEYQHQISCLFDDAFETAVNQINLEVQDFTKENFAELQKVKIKEANCGKITLQNIQDTQEVNGFKTTCSGKFSSRPYSACRVTETILNELGAYQNYLLAKSEDVISFSRENFEHDDYKNEVFQVLAKTKAQYLSEIKKSQKAAVTSLMLYKDFVHNYRVHAWLIAIKNKLKGVSGDWLKIQKALETFPAKFIDASSVGG